MRKTQLNAGFWGGFSIFFGLLLASCGDTKTLSLQFSDTVTTTAPQFIVSVQSNMSSNFSQNQVHGEVGDQRVYYFGDNTSYLKNCAVATSQVSFDSAYHSGSPSVTDCADYATQLRNSSLFPLAVSDIRAGSSLTLSEPGYVYALFFYNPTNNSSSLGTDVDAGQVVITSNRCVKIWAAKSINKKLIQSGGTESDGTINLATLKCYGF